MLPKARLKVARPDDSDMIGSVDIVFINQNVRKLMKPGVLSGQDYKNLIRNAKNRKFAIPAVNVTSSSILNAVLEAASSSRSDVIIQLSGGGAQFYAGAAISDPLTAKISGAVSAALHVHEIAESCGICVVLHTDHANRSLLPWVDGLIDRGEAFFAKNGRPLFSSHMIDLSEEPIETNLQECAARLRRLTPIGMSLEIELGITGGEEDGVGHDIDSVDNEKLYTQPEDVLMAYRRLSPLGHVSIAASFGNVHGVYKPGNVHLRPDILQASQQMGMRELGVDTAPFDFVFHGGSGSEQADIRAAIDYGVFKINVDTDTQFAYSRGVGKFANNHSVAFQHQLDPETGAPLKKLYDPRKWMREAELGMVERVKEAMNVSGSAGNTLCE